MARIYTVDNLVAEVRSLLDEVNKDTVSDTDDVLPALNRGQLHAANILSRHYQDPLIVPIRLTLEAGKQDYDIPEDALEDKLEKVEIEITGRGEYHEIQRISYRDISSYETSRSTPYPTYYCVIGRKFRLIPASNGTYPARVWYLREPDKLLLRQGRVTIVNFAESYILVDEVGTDISTETDDLRSYVNIVDGTTGLVKATLQIQSIQGTRIRFRSVPISPTVYGRDVDVADLAQVEKDDLICLAEGTCVSQLRDPVNNFLVQYAVAELTRKLGGEAVLEENILAKFEKLIERSWAGREQRLRIKKRSRNWDVSKSRNNWPTSE
jgi:hypothetical protein